MDHVILCMVNCCEESDDVVQTQLLNALFVACTSSKCAIHDTSLVLIVRAFMHLYLTSRNTLNRSTAKSHIMQLVDYVNMNMENAFADTIAKQVTKIACTPPPPPLRPLLRTKTRRGGHVTSRRGRVETKKDSDLPIPRGEERATTHTSGGEESPSANNPERVPHNHAAIRTAFGYSGTCASGPSSSRRQHHPPGAPENEHLRARQASYWRWKR